MYIQLLHAETSRQSVVPRYTVATQLTIRKKKLWEREQTGAANVQRFRSFELLGSFLLIVDTTNTVISKLIDFLKIS
jgi:hypothetical protein